MNTSAHRSSHSMRPTFTRGYIAIVSAIILSAILTALSISESMAVFWARFSQIDAMHRTQSLAHSDSCAYEALVAYADNPDLLKVASPTAPETLTIQPGITCSVVRALPNSTGVTIYVETGVSGAEVVRAVSATEITSAAGDVNFGNPLTAVSWKEVTSIPP